MSLTHDSGSRIVPLPQEQGQGRDIFVVALRCHENFRDIESQSNTDPHIVARIPSLFSAARTDKPIFTLDDLQGNHEQFWVWAKNLGVFASGHGSLDFRLREADDMREGVILLLRNLSTDLMTCLERIKTDRPESSGLSSNISDDSSSGSDESSGPDEAILSSAERTSYELQVRLGHIENILDKLFRLAGIIRASGVRSRTIRVAAYTQIQDDIDVMDEFEFEYLPRVLKHRFHIQDPLLGRFAKAISLRRRRFMYQARHQRRIAYGGEVLFGAPRVVTAPTLQSAIMTTSVPNSTRETLQNTEEVSRIFSGIQPPTKATTFEAQQTWKKAPSRLTSGSTRLDTTGITIPPPPPLTGRTAYFECPYCCILLPEKLQGQKAWRAHVIEDLQPFVCLEPDCPNPDGMFDSREDWVEHQKWEHSLEWWCDCGSRKDTALKFTTAQDFAQHLKMSHKPRMSSEAIARRVTIAGRPKLLPFSCCPLCDITLEEVATPCINDIQSSTDQMVSRQKELQKHISHQMLAIFLVALPGRDDTGCSDTHSESQERRRGTLDALSNSTLDFDHDVSIIDRPDDRDVTADITRLATEGGVELYLNDEFYNELWQEVWMSPQLQDSVSATYTGLQKDPILSTFFDLQAARYEESHHKILARLAFPEMRHRMKQICPPHRRTCEWILQLPEYNRWRTTSLEVLWIKGKPGAGKSTMMKFLYDTASAEGGVRLEFFFNIRGTVLQQSMIGMLQSLLCQLYDQDLNIRTLIAKRAHKLKTRGGENLGWLWPQQELEGLFADAVTVSARQAPVIIFIDALDEAGWQPAQEILRYFHDINDRILTPNSPHTPTLRICISCRHHPILSLAYDNEVNVERHNGNDIAMYIHDQLEVQGWGSNRDPDSGSWLSLADDLIRRAHGMFLWVTLAVHSLQQSYGEGESLIDAQQRILSLDPVMEGLFHNTIPKTIDPQHRALSLLLFQWVCLAERPLSVTEMRFALAANDATALPVRVRCHDTQNFIREDELLMQQVHKLSWGLVEVVHDTSGRAVVQAIHQSVVDFFLSKGLQLLASPQRQVSIDPRSSGEIVDVSDVVYKSQGVLYRCCLNYLATEDMDTAVEELKSRETPGYSKALISSPSSPFTTYATLNMLIHAEKAMGQSGMAPLDEVRLLKSTIGCWTSAFRAINENSTKCPRIGTTVLDAAATANLVNVVQYLIHNDIDIRDQEVGTALQLAAYHGHLDVVEVLLYAGADVNTQRGPYGTALQVASSKGYLEIVERLLQAGADVNTQRGPYGTALQIASSKGYLEIVKRLLRAGADVNARGDGYSTALQVASSAGHLEIVERLLRAGADVNARAGWYSTALYAASSVGHIEIVKRLLRAGADVNAQGGLHGTALQVASSKGRIDIVERLLQAGATSS